MKDYLISMFVDNELSLDEKVEFVETVHSNSPFKDETVALLNQEKLLQGDMVITMPESRVPVIPAEKVSMFKSWFAPLTGLATAAIVAASVFLLRPAPVIGTKELQHRFVIYHPDVNKADIVGDFTSWSPVPMRKIGDSGYWAITLTLPEGEHRYSYLVDNNRQIPDPTVLSHEQDDFGGENSIINIALNI
ncbi:MAG: hypothetical protein JRC87_07470 [Deltaproteobacteria bacterium]|nr:hypothetical protein [Deltaproteobacteria bacterium]MBW2659412.1 hypothetical protein [Deltaproteobacteria bacterium]